MPCEISDITWNEDQVPSNILFSAAERFSEAVSSVYSKLGIHDKYPNIDTKELYLWASNEILISFQHKGCYPIHLELQPKEAIYDMDQDEMYVMIFELIRNNMDLLGNPEIPVR